MKYLLMLLSSCIFYACTGTATDSTTTNADTSKKQTKDTVLISEEVSEPDPTDPDPSDTIPASRYGENTSSKITAEIVRTSLNSLFKDDLSKGLIDSFSRRFIFFEYDLNSDGQKEIFTGLTGSYFCGTGGCTFYILDAKGVTVSKFTVSDYPIVIDNNITKGWKDLFIQTGGKYHIVKFDGKKYPSNPSLQPLLKLIPGDSLPRALNYLAEPYPWFRF